MTVVKTGNAHNTKTTTDTDSIATGAPTGAAAGDFGVIFALLYGGTEGLATPAGWTALYGNVGFGTSGNGGRICVFYKTAISSGEASGGVTVSTNAVTGTRWANVQMFTFASAALATNSRVQNECGTTDNVTTTAVAVGANDLVLFLIADLCQGGDIGAPAGTTEVYDDASPLVGTIRVESATATPGVQASYSKTFTYSQFGGGTSRDGEAIAVVLTPGETPVSYTVINGTLAAVTGGATNVDSLSYKDGVSMLKAEVATLLGTDGVAVMKNAPAEGLRSTILVQAAKYPSA